MQLKLTKTAVRIGAVGALAAAAALGSTQAALAAPAQGAVSVPCSAAALASAISGASSGETLNLAKFCVYKLTEALPDVGDGPHHQRQPEHHRAQLRLGYR